MAKEGSLPLAIAMRLALNVALVWVLATYFGDFFRITGGWPAFVIVGTILMLLNLILRPILRILTLPLRLFATVLAIIVVNGAFVQIVYLIVQRLDLSLVTLEIGGGVLGWAIVATVLGVGNWLMKLILK